MFCSIDQKDKGFTLIELVVVILIVGLFAVLTMPVYQDVIRSGRRGDAKAELMRLANGQAKWRMTHKAYASLEELGGAAVNQDYTFKVAGASATAFAIIAAPTGSRGQDHDRCGTLTINQDAALVSNQSACPKP